MLRSNISFLHLIGDQSPSCLLETSRLICDFQSLEVFGRNRFKICHSVWHSRGAELCSFFSCGIVVLRRHVQRSMQSVCAQNIPNLKWCKAAYMSFCSEFTSQTCNWLQMSILKCLLQGRPVGINCNCRWLLFWMHFDILTCFNAFYPEASDWAPQRLDSGRDQARLCSPMLSSAGGESSKVQS